jgi:hypothetical protein
MNNKLFVVVVALLLLVVSVFVFGKKPTQLGSVTVGNEYYSTTTAATGPYVKTSTWSIKGGFGTLGQVVVLVAGSAGGDIALYDATTTNVNLRTGQLATSSILIASIPSNLAAGTYTFDANFRWGLTAVTTGTIGTTTILFR